MKLWQIDRAIVGLCDDIEKSINPKSYLVMSESEFIHELFICILGSGVRYEVAASYACAISSNICLAGINESNKKQNVESIVKILSSNVPSLWGNTTYKRYRYPNKRAQYIADSISNIYNTHHSITSLLSCGYTPYDLRREVIRLCPGIGPKQASHFLKNTGYTEKLAILDRHIIKYLEISGSITVSVNHVGKIDVYEEIEALFVKAVKHFNYSISIIDQSMWFVMRAMSRELLV